jgi:hypothetical protein
MARFGLALMTFFFLLAIWQGLLLWPGFVLGAVLVMPGPSGEAGRAALVALGRAVAPLGLPLLLVAIGGAHRLDPVVQLVFGVLVVVVCTHAILRPERAGFERSMDAIGEAARILLAIVGVVMVPAMILALVLWKFVWPAIELFQRFGGLTALLLTLAVLLWLAATVLRLASYARSWLRAGIAVLLALAAARVAMSVGVLPGHEVANDAGILLDPAVLVAVASGLVVADVLLAIGAREVDPGSSTPAARLHRLLQRTRSDALSESRAERAALFGLGSAMGSATALGIAVFVGLLSSGFGGNDRLTLDGDEIRTERPTVPPGKVRDDWKLASTYMPILSFTPDQRWTPIAVDSYVADARMIGPGGRSSRPGSLDELPTSCPRLSSTPCYRLTIDCPDEDAPCAGGKDRGSGRHRDGAAYYRVIRRSKTPGVFEKVGPYSSKLSILIQYWLFYRYDIWRTQVLAGELTQRHEGDWEAVMVGLSDDDPLFVAYSAHCGGSWRGWKGVDVAATQRPWTHPLVAVAEGSQANYPKADQRRAPDWAACAGVPPGSAALVSYAGNVRDRTDYAWEWYPEELIRADARRPPMSFPGTWGANDRTALENFRTQRLGKEGKGPRTPSLQPLWQRPVRTVFCDSHWEPRRC